MATTYHGGVVRYAIVTPTRLGPGFPKEADAEAWARAHAGDGWFAMIRYAGATPDPACVARARAQLAVAQREYDHAVRLAWAEGAAMVAETGDAGEALAWAVN